MLQPSVMQTHNLLFKTEVTLSVRLSVTLAGIVAVGE